MSRALDVVTLTGEQREWIVRGEAMPYYTAQPGESATIRAQVAPGRWEDVPRRSEANATPSEFRDELIALALHARGIEMAEMMGNE